MVGWVLILVLALGNAREVVGCLRVRKFHEEVDALHK